MQNYMIGMADTGDAARPWLIAICMIVSIVMVVALFIIGDRKNQENEDDDDE